MRCLASVRLLLSGLSTVSKATAAFVMFNNTGYHGVTWKSRQGNIIFKKYGSDYTISGQQRGKGFILDSDGNVIQEWSGKVPM
jgi:hypothetical protein